MTSEARTFGRKGSRVIPKAGGHWGRTPALLLLSSWLGAELGLVSSGAGWSPWARSYTFCSFPLFDIPWDLENGRTPGLCPVSCIFVLCPGSLRMSTFMKLVFVFSLKPKDQRQGPLIYDFATSHHLKFCSCSGLFSMAPFLSSSEQDMPSPCGTLRNASCPPQGRTRNYLYFIFWLDLLLGMDVRLFSFPAELRYICPFESLVQIDAGIIDDGWSVGRVRSCWLTTFNKYLCYWFKMWFNILGTSQKNLLSWLLVKQIIIYPSSSSLLPLMMVFLCQMLYTYCSFACIISILEISQVGIIIIF